MKEAKSSLSMNSWDEKTWLEGEDGRKLTRVEAGSVYEGAMRGEGTATWLLSYNPDGTGSAPGLERFAGEVDGRPGGFVMQHASGFDDKAVRDAFSICPGSGTGDLAGIRGEAAIEMKGKEPYHFTLHYELP